MQITNEIRFKHFEGSESITVVLRQPTSEEVSRFLKARFPSVRNKTLNQRAEAQIAFIDRILTGVDGLTVANAAGEQIPVGPGMALTEADTAAWQQRFGWKVATWKDLIPSYWKTSWALRFEENAAPALEDDAGPDPL